MQTHCFLNLWILLVFVSYFAQDLHYVSYKVFLIKGTGCNSEVADLGTQDIATMTPPELDTTRHTYTMFTIKLHTF